MSRSTCLEKIACKSSACSITPANNSEKCFLSQRSKSAASIAAPAMGSPSSLKTLKSVRSIVTASAPLTNHSYTPKRANSLESERAPRLGRWGLTSVIDYSPSSMSYSNSLRRLAISTATCAASVPFCCKRA